MNEETKKKIAAKYPSPNRSDYHTETEFEMVMLGETGKELRKAANYGYSLATDEIERLKDLIKTAYNTFYMRGFPHNEPTWKQFCEKNKL